MDVVTLLFSINLSLNLNVNNLSLCAQHNKCNEKLNIPIFQHTNKDTVLRRLKVQLAEFKNLFSKNAGMLIERIF